MASDPGTPRWCMCWPVRQVMRLRPLLKWTQVISQEAVGFPQATGSDLLEVPGHYLNVALVYDSCYDQLMPRPV